MASGSRCVSLCNERVHFLLEQTRLLHQFPCRIITGPRPDRELLHLLTQALAEKHRHLAGEAVLKREDVRPGESYGTMADLPPATDIDHGDRHLQAVADDSTLPSTMVPTFSSRAILSSGTSAFLKGATPLLEITCKVDTSLNS